MLNNIEVLCHSSIRIDNIYIDPYKITDSSKKATYIFITHPHYDHLSIDDIKKIITDKTVIICIDEVGNILIENNIHNPLLIVKPGGEYNFDNLFIKVLPAYNINKTFHPKEKGYVGYLIRKDNISYYIAGDTDNIDEIQNIKCDIAIIPIGGTYTMNGVEAAALINQIKPKIAIPSHYNDIVGTKKDEEEFISNVDKGITIKTYL